MLSGTGLAWRGLEPLAAVFVLLAACTTDAPAAPETSDSDGSSDLCGASDPTPICSSADARANVDVCVSPWHTAGPVTGTIVSTDASCSFSDLVSVLACEPSHLQIATEAGIVGLGICVPGGFTPPPVGSVVSVERTEGGDFCESFNQTVTVRDGDGNLLLHAVQNERISVREISTRERTPFCHTTGSSFAEQHVSLTLAVGSQSGTVKGGESIDIGDLNISLHRAFDTTHCDGDSECGYTHDLAVVRPADGSPP